MNSDLLGASVALAIRSFTIRRLPRAPAFAAIALVAVALLLSLPAAASAGTPDVTTSGAIATGASTAVVWGEVNPEGQTTSYAVEWDIQSSTWCMNGGTSGSPANRTAGGSFTFTDNNAHGVAVGLTGLSQLANYCARLVATNGDGESDGAVTTWQQAAPEVHTVDASSTSAATATVDGQINPLGQVNTFYNVEYDLASSTWCTSNGSSGPAPHSNPTELNFSDSTYHDVSVNLVQLATGAEYCARLMAYSAGGEAWGDFLTFSVDKPGAVTDHASSTGGATATVYGVVNPNGQTTTYEAQYDVGTSAWCTSGGTSGSPQATTPATLGFTDEEFHDVTIDVSSLTPTIEYCARLVAMNPNGDVHGTQVTWTQGSTPNAYTYDAYSTGGTTATVEGFVAAHSEDTTYVAQYDLATSAWCTSGGTSGSPKTTAGTVTSSDDYVSVNMTGLIEGADYCAQLVATDANGESDGGQVAWRQGFPTAETFDAYPTGDFTATVDGDVNPAGKVTTWRVQYDLASSDWCSSGGTSGSPAHATAATPLSSGPDFQDVSVNLTGLSVSTGYCAEIVATNVDGTSEGGQLFWTQDTPPPPLAVAELAITLTGTGSGTVTSSPAGIDCGSGHTSCSHDFAPGTQVTLTATPAVGSSFPGWLTPGCLGSKSPCTITMNTSRFVQVGFVSVTPPTSTVSVQRAGSGSGTVTSFPAGIDCGTTCSYAFDVRKQVQLTAVAAPGSKFAGWSGGGCSGTGTCSLTKAAGQTVTATFTENPPPPRCKVPKVKGKKLTAAKTAIRHAHCGVGKVTKAFSTKVKKGRVISTKPRAGSRHPRGTKVKLTVSKGRKP